jgi:hypothetical protein
MATRTTAWRRLVNRNFRFDDLVDYNGAAAYQLALGGPRGGIYRVVYVGEAGHLFERMRAYASHGSHLRREIDLHLRRGFTIYFRFRPLRSKAAAQRLEAACLARDDYDWNLKSNSKDAA